VVNITFWPLYPWERSLVPTEEEAEWAPELVVMFWKRKKSLLSLKFYFSVLI
jgi:hypothetical protein